MIHSTDLEQSLLSAIIQSPEALDCLEYLNEDDFYDGRNLSVFQVIKGLHDEGRPVDMLSVEGRLPDDIKIYNYADTSIYGNYQAYCQNLREYAIRRRIINASRDMDFRAMDKEEDTHKLVDDFNAYADSIDIGAKHEHSLVPSQIFQREENAPIQERLYTGDTKLDEGIYKDSGMKKGHIKLTIADSGHGKTSFALYEASCLVNKGYKIHWFQLEDYDVNTARHFYLNCPDMMDNVLICHELVDIEDIKREARRVSRERGTDYIVLDYVQNIEAGKRTKMDNVEYISQQITRMAKDMNVVINPISQVTLNYGSQHGWSLEPSKGHVRWSQQLKQDAHAIVSVFRPSEISELIVSDQVKDWKDNLHPMNSVWIRQAKIRYGEKDFRRYHLIHTDKGLKPYTDENKYPF